MASPAQLVEIVSQATGLPLATIVDIDRKLVKADLRSKGGRGFYAARMMPLDAARLLTAVLASHQASAAPDAVNRYAHTRVDEARSSDELFAAAGLADLSSLPVAHNFVDGLAALLQSASYGFLAKLVGYRDHLPRCEATAFTRATWGRIRIVGLPSAATASVEYVSERPGWVGANGEFAGDLEQSRRITERTIYSVARLLAEEGRNG